MQFISQKNRRSVLTMAIQLAMGTALVSPMLYSESAYAQDVMSTKHAQGKLFNLTLPAGDLSTALNEFAKQTGVFLTADASLTKNKKSTGLSGKFRQKQALSVLLKGSGIDFTINGNTVTLTAKNEKIITLETTEVRDARLGDNTEGTGSYTTGAMNSATGLAISLRETPQSVSVITSQVIQDQNLLSLTDVVNNTAGLSTRELDSTRFRFSSRGFSVNNFQIDGMPMPLSISGEGATSTAIYERIEVVRGATGLMNGIGNPSAAVNLIRKRANSSEFNGTATVSIGNWNDYRAMVDLSTGLNKGGSIRGRLVGDYEESDSFVDYASKKKSVFYGVIDADLTENTLLSTGVSYQNNQPKGTTWGGLPLWYSDGSRTNWERSKTTAAKWTYWNSKNTNYFLNLTHNLNDDWTIKVNLNQADNKIDRELLYMSGRVDKETGLGLKATPSKGLIETKQTDLGIHINGAFEMFSQTHELVFGTTYSEYDYHDYSYVRNARPEPGDFNHWDGSYPNPGFGEAELIHDLAEVQQGYYSAARFSLDERIKLIIGLRFTDWEQVGVSRGKEVTKGDDGNMPYAGILYDIEDNHTVYASFTEIFQPQDKIRNRFGKELDPITGSNYELGFKSEFFDGLLNTSVAIFQIKQDNLAEVDEGYFVPNTEPAQQAYVALEGTTSKGFEVEAVGVLLPGWNVTASYSQFDAESAEGNDIQTYSPRQLFKLYSSYNFSGALDKLTIGGGVNWQSENYTELKRGNPVTKTPETLKQESYALVSIMARYEITSQLTVQFNINNALDKNYASQIGFYSQYAYGEPRSINLNMGYQF
ncbi:ferripyoverdine/pyocin S3 receptor FpvA [Colwellia asteriadis]|uniref:Ferripyoverdine/pyocin S3 receptor FpvA n=1 Tax=Colwellia asteriadis TaxID=517723 RepID=A0ABN1L7C7_9GAMM